MGREELIRRLESEFGDLLAALGGLSEETASRVCHGDWSTKEVLAHIAGWHREMTGAFERLSRGERASPPGVDYNDTDGWNARLVEQYRGKSWEDMVEELKASKEAFVAAARLVPEERFEEGKTAARLLQRPGFEHYQEHIGPLLEWRKREGV